MEGDWARAGAAIRAARTIRWRRRADFARATGLSVRLISDIESGRRTNFSQETKLIIEGAIGWEEGSIDRVAQGGKPRPVRDRALRRVILAWPSLSRDAREMLADLAERRLRD